MARKYIDCRDFPSDKECTLAISGSEEEVLDLAVLHASTVHGHPNTPASSQGLPPTSPPRLPAYRPRRNGERWHHPRKP